MGSDGTAAKARDWRRWGRLAATAAFTWHLAALTLPQLTRAGVLGAAFQRVFSPYTQWTGTWGTWEMFTTIPYFHSYDVTLEARDQDGKGADFGAMLPGLTPFDGRLRPMLFFMRIAWDQDLNRRYLHDYVERACAALRARGFAAKSVTLRVEASRLRKLSDIAADGYIGEQNNFLKGPIRCPSEG